MKQSFQFNLNRVSVNGDWTKVYVIQSKSGIIMSISLNVKNKMNGVLIKMTLCGSTCTYDCKCNKVCRIDEYLDTKMCSCKNV